MRCAKMKSAMPFGQGLRIPNALTSGSGAKCSAVSASPLRAKSFRPNARLLSILISGNGGFPGFTHQENLLQLRLNWSMGMKGDPKVIEHLNICLKNELTAVNQYWLHYRMLDNWGVAKLAAFERHESIDEMKHADKLAERILFLDGLPNFQALGRLRIGETVEEILKADYALEEDALPPLRDAIAYCESIRDFVSRDLFAYILTSEEDHVDELEKQFDMIRQMGIANYIQLQSKPPES
jgi:bacterioferritin